VALYVKMVIGLPHARFTSLLLKFVSLPI